jgi:hypothetical protein
LKSKSPPVGSVASARRLWLFPHALPCRNAPGERLAGQAVRVPAVRERP